MVNIKVRGFDSHEELREYLEEIDETPAASPQDRRLRQETASLKVQLEDLKIRVEEGWSDAGDQARPVGRRSPFLLPVLPVVAVVGLALILLSWTSNRRTLAFHRW